MLSLESFRITQKQKRSGNCIKKKSLVKDTGLDLASMCLDFSGTILMFESSDILKYL